MRQNPQRGETLARVTSDPIDRIRDLSCWSGPPRIEAVTGGRTNQNYRVISAGQSFFARIGVDLPHHNVSRANEVQCARLAASLGIAPEVVYVGEGILITPFVEGHALVQGERIRLETLERVTGMLAKLHAQAPPGDLPAFDPAVICRMYIDELSPGTLVRRDRDIMEGILDGAPPSHRRGVIHADVLPENVIDDGSRLWLVDWEYAGAGEPAVDLAIMAMNFELSDEQILRLAARHGDVQPDSVRAFRQLVALREALWCLVQIQTSGARGDLVAYSRMCLRRLGIVER